MLDSVLPDMNRCALALGIHPDDSDLVSVYSLLYPFGSGIGSHADSNPTAGKTLWMMRLVIGLGARRKVTFTAYRFSEDEDSTDMEKS